ncbi:DEAD/DEAH box helicase [Methylomonas rapida]|uniref:DEAD/DEAH box helicase n=1 Tax=Methylomonas rapida TaxID=2963939 RepID=A0ABY7GHH6_9GAMM|nr:DEAD/DEAH box helicase [Methylomonas rapida]WAR44712.1 DEAD/DEAH box helicase [Methylomonas rapida]
MPELFTAGAVIDDQRRTVAAQISFTGQLRDYQQRFVSNAMQAGGGVMVAATGSGKTVSGIALAAQLQQRCLILVKSKDLAEQWRAAIEQFTGLNAGLIGSGKDTEGEQFTIATVQTLVKRDLSRLNYGMAIADECHNAPASQFYQVINGLNCRYKFGLSATPQRRDGLEMMIHAALGPIVAEIKPSEVEGAVLPVVVSVLHYQLQGNPQSWQQFNKLLAEDNHRNQLIVNRAIRASLTTGTAILTSTIEHAERLHQIINQHGRESLLLHGQLPAKVRAERMAAAANYPIIVGTLSLLSEGIDWPHVGAVVFAAPVSAEVKREAPAATRLLQSIGRARRPFPGKKCAYVLDIVDKCAFGFSAARKRGVIYRKNGFEVRNHGN